MTFLILSHICFALQLSGSERKPARKSMLLPVDKWKIAKDGLDGWDAALSVSVAVSQRRGNVSAFFHFILCPADGDLYFEQG